MAAVDVLKKCVLNVNSCSLVQVEKKKLTNLHVFGKVWKGLKPEVRQYFFENASSAREAWNEVSEQEKDCFRQLAVVLATAGHFNLNSYLPSFSFNNNRRRSR